MSRKAVIAILTAALLALAAAPGAAQAQAKETCPPGTSSGPYCEVEKGTGVELAEHKVHATHHGKFVLVKLHCHHKTTCKGKIDLLGVSGKSPLLGAGHYKIKPGKTSDVKVKLNGKAKKILAQRGKVAVKAFAVSKGSRESLGRLTIKGKKASKHHHHRSTHTTTEPGFTG